MDSITRAKLIYYEGVSSMFPANTSRAISVAVASNASMVLLPLKITEDKVPVVIRNSEWSRYGYSKESGLGYVHKMKLYDLKKIDIGSWFHIRHHQERVLTLKEALKITKRKGKTLILEICKAGNEPAKNGIIKNSIKEINKLEYQDPILFASENLGVLLELKLQGFSDLIYKTKSQKEIMNLIKKSSFFRRAVNIVYIQSKESPQELLKVCSDLQKKVIWHPSLTLSERITSKNKRAIRNWKGFGVSLTGPLED